MRLAAALTAVGRGDRAALREVYDMTAAKLFGICLRICGERASAEDVLQTVYIKVWERAGQFDAARASPITWLATIARNGAIDWRRSVAGRAARDNLPEQAAFAVADEAPRALQGYFLMREWALSENLLESKYVELLLCTVNAAEFSSRFVGIHAVGARNAGATETEIVEAVVCAIPISGVASWLPGADGVRPPKS